MTVIDCGFIKAGEWHSKSKLKSGIDFKLSQFENDRVIYVFVVDDKIDTPKYIGICEDRKTTLKDRMRRYKNLQGDKTNKRIVKTIKECLDQYMCVEIYALKPGDEYFYKDLKVDMIKGLEGPFIEKFDPEWNIKK